ncbi:MAG: biopolymer transporter ExbD [Myxococcales bacterium]|nr:biopolymer transporter ExbD [Myxococcales bacterium]
MTVGPQSDAASAPERSPSYGRPVPVRRLRASLRRIREQGEEQLEDSGELNLVPYLDIVMNIIMFLLATVQFQAMLANINITLPTAALTTETTSAPKPELNLTVSISDAGYTLATSGSVLYRGFRLTAEGVVQTTSELPTLPKAANQLDLDGLSQILSEIKDRFPDEERAVLTASPQIPYEQVVKTMDAMREWKGRVLFPGVLLSAGVQ